MLGHPERDVHGLVRRDLGSPGRDDYFRRFKVPPRGGVFTGVVLAVDSGHALGDDVPVLARTALLIAALATGSSTEHLRICREWLEAPDIEEQIGAFRAANGREPASIRELMAAGYLPDSPGPPWDRDYRPFVLVRGVDGRTHVAREGGAPLATAWVCNRPAYIAFALGAVVLVAGVAASVATRRRRFALLAVAVVASSLACDRCVGPPQLAITRRVGR